MTAATAKRPHRQNGLRPSDITVGMGHCDSTGKVDWVATGRPYVDQRGYTVIPVDRPQRTGSPGVVKFASTAWITNIIRTRE